MASFIRVGYAKSACMTHISPECKTLRKPAFLFGLVATGLFVVVKGAIPKSKKELDQMRQRCARTKQFNTPVRKVGDLNTTFMSMSTSPKFSEYSPTVISSDPWILYFEKFLSEDEVAEAEKLLFEEDGFVKSSAGFNGESSGANLARHSETRYCMPGGCDELEIVKTIHGRVSAMTNVPVENMDLLQAARYKQGMFYRTHHDNHPTFHLLPSGPRIYTMFVYLSTPKGGATRFPMLNRQAPAKRGAAVLFVNTQDNEPEMSDERTEHEAMKVLGGVKKGLNIWLYQYNYRHFWQKECTSIELADSLERYGYNEAYIVDSDAPTRPSSDNLDKRMVVEAIDQAIRVMWRSPDDGKETEIGKVDAHQKQSFNTFVGHEFVFRTQSNVILRKYTVVQEPAVQDVLISSTNDKTINWEL